MKLISLLIAGITLIAPDAFAMEEVKFNSMVEYIQDKNFPPLEKFLTDNKKILAEDPEYYVILLNYVFSKGERSGLVVEKGAAASGDLELRDTGTGMPVGFIGQRSYYDKDLIVDGVSQAQKGLKKYGFNHRLDIHFGIVWTSEQIERWDIVSEQLVEVLRTSIAINNKWQWGPINSMEGDPKEFMIQETLSRTSKLFRIGTPAADKALREVSEALVKYYPEEIFGYANLGALHLVNKEYDLAQNYFKKALSIDPNDQVVLANLKKLEAMQK